MLYLCKNITNRLFLGAFLVLAFALTLRAEPPAHYYDSTLGKTGADLRAAVHALINSHTVIPYSSSSFDTSDALKVLDEDPVNTNNVIGIYSRLSIPKSDFGTTSGWNREHLWCNTYGLDMVEPAYSDLFNLRGEDATVNSTRGDKYYDISNPGDPGYHAPGAPEAPMTSTDSDSWQPPNVAQGDIARAVFYMDVCYEGDHPKEMNLIVTDNVGQINSSANFMGRLGTLFSWHQNHPVTDAERSRNDKVFNLYQHNRNPFVDHPEFVVMIFTPNQTAPAITNQPQGLTLNVGENASFSVVGLGASPISYQWQINGSNIAGANLAGFTITNAQLADAGDYTVAIANSLGAITSSIAALVISGSNAPPFISGQPQGLNVNTGDSAFFHVMAGGSNPLSYQWMLNGTNLPGATQNNYSIANAQPDDSGTYSVLVSNPYGMVFSSNATLVVTSPMLPPGIAGQPQNQIAIEGGMATFAVAASGTLPLSYQWRFNGAEIPSANTSVYKVLEAGLTNAGNYDVVITNAYGAITSSVATLVVNMPGTEGGAAIVAQWNFNNSGSPVSAPTPTMGVGTSSLVGGTTSAFVSGTGSTDTNASNQAWNTTTYPAQGTGNKTRGAQFRVSTTGYENVAVSFDMRLSNTAGKYYRLQYTTNGIDYIEFAVVAVTNTTNAFEHKTNNLSGVAGVKDNPNFGIRVLAEFESTAAQTANAMYVTPSGAAYGTAGTTRFDMMTIYGSVIPPAVAPSITDQPQSLAAVAGMNATFTVGAAGTGPLGYQWQLAGTNLPMATNAFLSLTNVSESQAGNYSVIVTNTAGFAVSSNAVLSVYTTAAATLSAVTYSGSAFQFTVTGVPGQQYSVEASSNLVDWISVATNVSPWVFTQTNNIAVPARFYRSLHLP